MPEMMLLARTRRYPHPRSPECDAKGCVPVEGEKHDLTFAELRRANLNRLAHFPGHTESDEPWSANDWAVAVAGELGELCNMLKKRRRGASYPGMSMPTDEDIAGELADVQTYLDLLAAYLGVDLSAAIVRKFNQVSDRWGLPDKL